MMMPAISRVTLAALVLHILSTAGAYKDLTAREKNFLSVFNGYFTNTQHILKEVQSKSESIHPFSDVLFIPYKVPALPEKTTVFFEESLDNVSRSTIAYVSEDDQGQILLELFDLTIKENGVLGTYDNNLGSYDIEQLNNLKPEELSSRPECTVVFKEVSELTFEGHWPDCSMDVVGARPYYTLTSNCTSMIAKIHSAARESSGGSEYVYILAAYKFPSPYYDNSDDPCSKDD